METCDESKVTWKRKFVESWLSDDRYKSWIHRVSFDNTMFHCSICDKNFSCGSSHVSRHAYSAYHRKIVSNKDSINIKNEKLQRTKRFRHQWLDIKEFQPWLREAPNDINSVFCLICDRLFACGLSQIYRHSESKLHKDNLEKYGTGANKSNEDLNTQTDESLLSFEKRVKSAEIRYVALLTEKNIPHQTAQEILKFFQRLGEDPNVLKDMSMGKTKCKNIIANVLCPTETERVVNSIQNTPFSLFISVTSDLTNNKWMTFLVRYVDSETLDIQSQLVKLIYINAKDYAAEKLFDAFQPEMYKLQIPFSNILALSYNNTSIMAGNHLSFKSKLEDTCKNLLTFACPCYSATLAAHAACAEIPKFCEELLRKMSNFINSKPKSCLAVLEQFYECFQNTNPQFLELCHTPWLSYYPCINRLLESWDTIKDLLNKMAASEKIKFDICLLSLMDNVDIKAYFLFLKYVLSFFNEFITYFQVHETRIHWLYSKSINFLIRLSQNFLKHEVMEHLSTNIIFSEQNNHKPINDINLGSECENYLHELVKEGHAGVLNIRQKCLQFYIIAAEEIRNRLPIHDIFLCKLQTFQPHVALLDYNRETSFTDVSFIAKILNRFHENGLHEEWLALYDDFTTDEKENLSKLDFDDMWKEILKRHSNNIAKYPNLRALLSAIRSLPHSNADPERMFSLLSNLKTYKRNRLSSICINATCVFKSALRMRGETAFDMEVNEKHLSLMSTDTLYGIPSKRSK